MASELDQHLLPPTQQPESQTETRGSTTEQPGSEMGQIIQNLTQMKSYDILTSAVRIFSADFRSMFLMILSVIPLYLFMIFFEIKLQNTLLGFPYYLPSNPYFDSYPEFLTDVNASARRKEFVSSALQTSLFYLLVYPVLEIFAVIPTIKLAAAKTHAKQPTKPSNFEGSLITYLCVHLLSTVILLGLFWVVLNHHLLSYKSFPYLFWHGYAYGYEYGYGYEFFSIELWVNILSTGLHSAGFAFLLYKYLGWSALWNMAMVISVLEEEEETGIDAFGLSDYYGKHCRRTGFQVMLVLFEACNVLRLLGLYFGMCSWSFGGVFVAAFVVGVFCVGNLVKWVAMVLYFYDCKKQVMEKKGDDVC